MVSTQLQEDRNMFKDSSQAYSGFAVKDIAAAKAFYGDKLGLDVRSVMGEAMEIHLPGGARVFVYPKGDHVAATYTILNFPVPDVERRVDELTKAGVQMEHYDSPDLKTDAKGIARDSQGPTIAWFKDPSGNILSVHDETPM
jgi:catechol 2,3-dioxygenase-like lactoylglutathione lyase family enzyme